MLPAEVRSNLHYIEIVSQRSARSVQAGDFRSRHYGRGFEFDEHRPYRSGEDFRMIDWNVTARLQQPFIKRNFEERELSAVLVVDGSASMEFSSGRESKRLQMLETAATLAFSAISDGLRLGLLVFTNQVELYYPPQQGRARVWNMLDALWALEPRSRRTDLEVPMRFLAGALKKMSIIFFLSDFLGEAELAASSSYKLLARRHDFIPVVYGDPLEAKLPPGRGILRLRDAETGQTARLSLTPASRDEFEQAATARQAQLESAFFRRGIAPVRMSGGENPVMKMMQFFLGRKKR